MGFVVNVRTVSAFRSFTMIAAFRLQSQVAMETWPAGLGPLINTQCVIRVAMKQRLIQQASVSAYRAKILKAFGLFFFGTPFAPGSTQNAEAVDQGPASSGDSPPPDYHLNPLTPFIPENRVSLEAASQYPLPYT